VKERLVSSARSAAMYSRSALHWPPFLLALQHIRSMVTSGRQAQRWYYRVGGMVVSTLIKRESDPRTLVAGRIVNFRILMRIRECSSLLCVTLVPKQDLQAQRSAYDCDCAKVLSLFDAMLLLFRATFGRLLLNPNRLCTILCDNNWIGVVANVTCVFPHV